MGALMAGGCIGVISGGSLEAILSLGEPSADGICRACAVGAEAGAGAAMIGIGLGRLEGFKEGYTDAGGKMKEKSVKPPTQDL